MPDFQRLTKLIVKHALGEQSIGEKNGAEHDMPIVAQKVRPNNSQSDNSHKTILASHNYYPT
jgi:hypothetical protein